MRKRERKREKTGLGYKPASGKKRRTQHTLLLLLSLRNSRGKDILRIVHAPVFHKAKHDHLVFEAWVLIIEQS